MYKCTIVSVCTALLVGTNYRNVCFFHSQKYWPHPRGESTLEGFPCQRTEGASAPGGGVHDDAQPNPPMKCQMPKGHLNNIEVIETN